MLRESNNRPGMAYTSYLMSKDDYELLSRIFYKYCGDMIEPEYEEIDAEEYRNEKYRLMLSFNVPADVINKTMEKINKINSLSSMDIIVRKVLFKAIDDYDPLKENKKRGAKKT